MILIYRGVRYNSVSEPEQPELMAVETPELSGQPISGKFTPIQPLAPASLQEVESFQRYKTLLVLVLAAIAAIANLM
ncbi:MAG: hypothetical protein F6K32_19160 [Desertifilum sp. SIO1I2]|nr:hypothetical protein [Desertifilum sp. SIO1I2]